MKIKLLFLFAVAGLFLTTKAKSQARINYISDTSANFNSLLGRFKGKIVYVDIWASWCSPCRHELQQKTVKEFEAFTLTNDIVMLYICCDKNGNYWKSFISKNKLSGYHILVTKNLDMDFHTTFSSVQNRNGAIKRSFYLPRHIIVNKAGVVADSTAGSQGSAAVYTSLKRLLN